MTNRAKVEHAAAASQASTPTTRWRPRRDRPRARCDKALTLRWAASGAPRCEQRPASTGHLEQTDHGTRFRARSTPGVGSGSANTAGKRRRSIMICGG
jgi:hypothetical protein